MDKEQEIDVSLTAPPESGEPAIDASEAPVSATPSLTEQLAQAQAKAAENYDLFVRAKAETENIRRRASDDVAKAHKFAIESFAEALLPVRDALEAALADQSGDPAKLREGVELTLKQLSSAFERGRIQEVNPVGEKFDPSRHQAVSAVPAPEGVAPNHVVNVFQKGYVIAERMLRPALVTVAQS